MTASEKSRFGKQFILGKASIGPQLHRLCHTWVELNEDALTEWLRRTDAAGQLVPLPSPPHAFAKEACHRVTRACPDLPPSPPPAPAANAGGSVVEPTNAAVVADASTAAAAANVVDTVASSVPTTATLGGAVHAATHSATVSSSVHSAAAGAPMPASTADVHAPDEL